MLRQAWREGRLIRRETIANLSKLPLATIHAICIVLKGGVAFPSLDQAVTIRRSLPHGHVAALFGLSPVSGNELLAMLDWLRQGQN